MEKQKNLYIAFVKSNTNAGVLIRKLTGWRYSHISISLDDNLEEYHAFSRLNYKSSFIAGYTKEYKSNYSQLKNKKAEITYYKIPITKKELDKINNFIEDIKNDKEYIFNYPSMFTTTILHGFELYKSYNCITFVTKILTFINKVKLERKYYKYDLNNLEDELKKYYYKEESFIITKLDKPNSFYNNMPYILRKKEEIKLFNECIYRLIFKKPTKKYSIKNDKLIKTKTIKTFNKQSKVYDKSLYGYNPRKNYHKILSRLKLNKDSLIDIGCGTGEVLNIINNTYPNTKLYGLDISKDMIKVAKKKDKSKRIEYVVGDAENIPYKDNSFDILITSESFHHYPNPSKAINEFHRVLKNNAKLILCDMYRPFGIRHIMNIIFKFINTGDVKMYSKKEIIYLLEENGFKIKTYNKYYSSYIIEAINEDNKR